MKNAILLFLIIIFPKSLFASNSDSLRAMIRPGNKVYVVAENSQTKEYATKFLKPLCWKIVDKPSEADFVIKFVNEKKFVDYFAYAVFFDPKTKAQIYKTPSSNTLMSASLSIKKAAIRKLVQKRIAPLCDTAYFDSSEFNEGEF